MDWNTLPLWVRAAGLYLFGCAFITFLFGVEWALGWWDSFDEFDIGEYSALEEAEWKEKRR